MVKIYKVKYIPNTGADPIWRYFAVYDDAIIANYVAGGEQDDIAPLKLYAYIKKNNLAERYNWHKPSMGECEELNIDSLTCKKIMIRVREQEIEKDFEDVHKP